MKKKLLVKITKAKNNRKPLFAVLVDPEKCNGTKLFDFIKLINKAKPDFIFLGGSQLNESIDEAVVIIKNNCKIPVILFIGNAIQFSSKADAILILSLISGRNPDFLIGQHVQCSQKIKQSGIETISTGYILVDGGKVTSVEKISKTTSLSDTDIIVRTAIAGELLGQQLIYLEAGSGAKNPVNSKIISKVKQNINIPLIVGGGICSENMIVEAIASGADIVVVGNHLEQYPYDIIPFVQTVKRYR